MRPALSAAIRAYAIACAAIVLLMAPWFVASFGVVREQPLRLRARSDVVAVSFGGGEWMPARGIAAVRRIAAIPPGTRICYRLTSGEVRCGDVRNVAEAPARTAARTVTAILALAFALAGAILARVGVDRRAYAAAGMLAGIGLLFGADFLEPTLIAIGDPTMQLIVIASWSWFPRYAGLLAMLVFAREFPATLPRSRVTSALLATVAILVISATAINGIAHMPNLLERTSLQTQRSVIALVLLNQQLVYAVAALGVIVLAIRQQRQAATRPAHLRRSGRLVAAAILFGFAPPMTLGILQVILNFAIGRRPIPLLIVAASFLTLLAVPAAIMTAVMAKRVDTIRILARRAVLFTLADRVVPILKIAPLAAAAVLLYINRDHSIRSVFEQNRIAFVALFVAAAVIFAFAEPMRRALRAYFHRNDAASRERLAALPSLVAQTDTVEAVASLLEREIEAVFRPETFALLVRDERENAFRSAGGELPPLSATAAVAVEIAKARAPVSTSDLDRKRSEADQHWITVARADLFVPLIGSDQELIGIMVLGESPTELYDDADKAMLMTVASASALAIENQRLRGRAPQVAATITRSGDDDPALVCPRCNRYEAPAVASRCPIDDAELQLAEVPYVLAGKYRFEQRLGAGGMGVVYRARDLPLERDVAIKTLPRLSPDTAARLRREARTAANLIHPNLATVFAVESWRGIPMLVLEYLDAGTLADRMSSGAPLPVETVVRFGVAIAEALHHVHARTILHRDVKPSNIGLSRGAEAKLLDFGLARLLEDSAVQLELLAGEARETPRSLTVTTGLVGTPAYLSPEAILGQPPHPDFDLWALSVTLYEAVTGSHPFVADTIAGTMNRVLARNVPDPRDVRRDCPPGLSQFLLDSLSHRRESRPRTALEMASRLRGVGG